MFELKNEMAGAWLEIQKRAWDFEEKCNNISLPDYQ